MTPASPYRPQLLRIPDSLLRALGRGRGGVEAVNLLRRVQYSKNLLLIRAAVRLAAERGHAEAHVAAAGYRLLGRMTEHAPRAAERVIVSPLTGLWALHTVHGLRETADPELTRPGLLADLAEQLALEDAGEAHVRADAGGLGLDLRLIRIDPRYLPAVRVDETLTSDGPRLHRWRRNIDRGWRLLVDHHRGVAEEVAATMSILVPQLRTQDGYSSSTLRHGFGMLMMSTPPDARTAATTLAHEVQHAKLSALMDLLPMVKPDDRADRFYAPWRPDPRPAAALLHGAYAHLGVAGFWLNELRAEKDRAARVEAEIEFVRWRSAAAEACRVLLDADILTPTGDTFVVAMSGRLDEWDAESVPAASRAEADRRNAAHLYKWQQANPDRLTHIPRSGRHAG